MRILILLLSFVTILSCRNRSYDKPDNLIPEDKMVDIISEFMIINAAKGVNKKILEDHIEDPTAYVFEKFQIDSVQFEQSNAYYARNIERYTSIYNRVSQKLEFEKRTIENRIEAQNKRLDSLKKRKLSQKDSIPILQKSAIKPKTLKMRPQSKKIDSLRESLQQ